MTLGIAVAFAGMLATLMLTLALAARLDRAWRILRRAAGHEQQEGMLRADLRGDGHRRAGRFSFWFWILEGPMPSLAPR